MKVVCLVMYNGSVEYAFSTTALAEKYVRETYAEDQLESVTYGYVAVDPTEYKVYIKAEED